MNLTSAIKHVTVGLSFRGLAERDRVKEEGCRREERKGREGQRETETDRQTDNTERQTDWRAKSIHSHALTHATMYTNRQI